MALQQFNESYVDAASVNSNIDVYSYDGDKLGVVGEVWADIPQYGYVARSRFSLADQGPVRGTAGLLVAAGGYVEIVPGRGIRRDGQENLYVPLDEIEDLVPGQALIIGDHGEACRARFTARPEGLDRSV